MRARRLLASLNLAATLLLLGVLFILINWVASRRYVRWDASPAKITTLSEKTLQTLKALSTPVSVVVFYQPGQRLAQLVADLLAEYERRAPQLTVEFVDPERDLARAMQLAQELKLEQANLVIVRAGARRKIIEEPELAEYDFSAFSELGPQIRAFKGEEALTAALLNVTQTTQPLVWLVSGHGEKSAQSREITGLSQLQRALEQQNLRLETVTLLERTEIPKDVQLLLIAGPTRAFAPSELAVLQRWMDHGGRLLALLDPLQPTDLEPWLASWGVQVDPDLVVDPARQLPFVSAANLMVTTYTKHPIVEKMKTLITLFPLARSVRPTQPLPASLTVTPLALTSEAGWGEMQTEQETAQFTEGTDLKGPVPIAVAVERNGAPPVRLVVVGDSDFVSDSQLLQVGNRDFLLAAVNWLASQEQLIGIAPKTLEAVRLQLTRRQAAGVFWFSFTALPLACGLLGALMWWLRRT